VSVETSEPEVGDGEAAIVDEPTEMKTPETRSRSSADNRVTHQSPASGKTGSEGEKSNEIFLLLPFTKISIFFSIGRVESKKRRNLLANSPLQTRQSQDESEDVTGIVETVPPPATVSTSTNGK
jgi:hypothetical protein